MKSKFLTAFITLFAILFIQLLQIKAQSCSPSNLSIVWTTSADIDGDDDIIWDIEPIDTNADGKADDGFIIAGEARVTSLNRQALIMRLRRNGSIAWQKTYGGNSNEVAYAVEQASDDNLILCGSKKSTKYGTPSNSNVWFFKLYLTDGDTVPGSLHEYGGSGFEDGYDIKEDINTGYYIIAGGTGANADGDLGIYSDINALGEYWVFAVDPANSYDTVWQHKYHGAYPSNAQYADWAESIEITHSGFYVVSGYCASCDPDHEHQEAMLLKLNSSGGLIWKQDFGYIDNDTSRDQGSFSIIEIMEGSSYAYLSTGVTHPSGNHHCFDGNNHDVYELKVDTNGNNIWTGGCQLDEGLGHGGEKKDNGFCAVQTCDGNYLLVGYTYSPSGDHEVTCNHSTADSSDVWILKTNTSGTKLWDESLGGDRHDQAHSIKRVLDGSYVIAGETGTVSSPINQNIYVVKFELTSCIAPTGLTATPSGCNES